MNRILMISNLVLLLGLLACFAAIYSTNLSMMTYEAHIAFLNKKMADESTERRVLKDRLWGLEDRHERKMMQLAKQYDIMMAAQRGGWRTTDRLIMSGAFDQ